MHRRQTLTALLAAGLLLGALAVLGLVGGDDRVNEATRVEPAAPPGGDGSPGVETAVETAVETGVEKAVFAVG